MTCDAGFLIFGVLCVRLYGIVLMLGALAGGYLATWEVKRRGKDPEQVWDLLVYLIIGGVIGARLWHVLTPSPSAMILDASGKLVNPYFVNGIPQILDILSIWKGGLGIPGTIIGGLVALYLYARKHREFSFAEWTDIAAPSLALGQAIGRWGNFFNQELYGAPTSLPWHIFIAPAHRLPGFEDVSYYHPLFAYESLLNLANMLLLIWITRRFSGSRKHGDVFNVYLIVYPLIRFSLDFLRLDASQVFGLNINQTVMAVVGILAIGALVWRHRPGSQAAPAITGSFAHSSINSAEMAASPAAEVGRPEVTHKTTAQKRTRPTTRRKPTRRA
ncbi:MAG TPA: prolipoprotein diacylglyceryl transferase [Anaerolineales bacterium]